jgi:hypothetical protein
MTLPWSVRFLPFVLFSQMHVCMGMWLNPRGPPDAPSDRDRSYDAESAALKSRLSPRGQVRRCCVETFAVPSQGEGAFRKHPPGTLCQRVSFLFVQYRACSTPHVTHACEWRRPIPRQPARLSLSFGQSGGFSDRRSAEAAPPQLSHLGTENRSTGRGRAFSQEGG